MEAIAVHQPLNETQIHFVQTLQFVKTDTMMQELQQVVSEFYFKKMEEEGERWWQENNLTEEKVEAMFSDTHYRTSYQ